MRYVISVRVQPFQFVAVVSKSYTCQNILCCCRGPVSGPEPLGGSLQVLGIPLPTPKPRVLPAPIKDP